MTAASWIDVSIERLAESGEGVGFDKSGIVLVRGAMPGDQVRVKLAKKSRVAEAVDWVELATDRLIPRCAVADRCGGCTWQHVPPQLQAGAVLEAARRALPKPLRELEIQWHPSEAQYGYRTRARIAWKFASGQLLLGHRAASSNDIVDTSECPVLAPALSDALDPLRRALARIGGSGEAFLAAGRDGKPVVTLRANQQLSADGFAAGAALLASGFAGVELYAPGATAPAVDGDPRPVVRGFDDAPLTLASEGFAQANEALNLELVRTVVERARCEGKKVLELFAGAGNFTIAIARKARKVSAVELDGRAVRAMQDNLAARAIDNVAAREGPSEIAARSHRSWDVVVLDPPRQGAADVIAALVEEPPKRVVYVSCDPATCSRDVQRLLGAGMSVESIDAFEMFPQTPHVELVVALSRRGGARP
jgi:23S rRNA (uracil1939-C5)-methyltransferase